MFKCDLFEAGTTTWANTFLQLFGDVSTTFCNNVHKKAPCMRRFEWHK